MSDIDQDKISEALGSKVRPADSAQFGQFGLGRLHGQRNEEDLAHRVADLAAELEKERREHLATQELHERSMRMIEEAIGPTRDLFEGWRAEVSAKAIASIVSQLSTCIEQLAAAEKRVAYFDDPTPLTAEIVMEMLPANCNVGKPWESGDYAGLLTINWFESLKTRGTLRVSSTPLDISDIGTLGAFRRLATGIGIQLKEDV